MHLQAAKCAKLGHTVMTTMDYYANHVFTLFIRHVKSCMLFCFSEVLRNGFDGTMIRVIASGRVCIFIVSLPRNITSSDNRQKILVFTFWIETAILSFWHRRRTRRGHA